MIEIMRSLEPIRIERDTKLFIEQEEVTEVYFFMKGIFEIGFNINLETCYSLRYKNYSVVGAYALPLPSSSVLTTSTRHRQCAMVTLFAERPDLVQYSE